MHPFKKTLLFILLLFLSMAGFANMAMPEWMRVEEDRNYSGLGVSGSKFDILDEKIFIDIDENFRKASFIVKYHIKADTSVKDVPVVFIAKDYSEGFKVWIDDIETNLLPATVPTGADTSGFKAYYDKYPETSLQEHYHLGMRFGRTSWEWKYFNASLSKGEHTIEVRYIATAFVDAKNTIKNYSFRYDLAPAKYWHSFHNLEITVDNHKFGKEYETNLSGPVNGSADKIATWNYSVLPDNYFYISSYPKINFLLRGLIDMGPLMQLLLIGLILGYLHFSYLVYCRKRDDRKGYKRIYNTAFYLGNIISITILFIFFSYLHEFISWALGKDEGYGADASLGYGSFVYPFIFLFLYWVIMWIALKIRFYNKRG